MGAIKVHAVAEEEAGVDAREADVVEHHRALVLVRLGNHHGDTKRPRSFLPDVTGDRSERVEGVRDVVHKDDIETFHRIREIHFDLDRTGFSRAAVRADAHEFDRAAAHAILARHRLDRDRQIAQEHEPASEQTYQDHVLALELTADSPCDPLDGILNLLGIQKNMMGHESTSAS